MNFGILGGAFDPFHSEHKRIAGESMKALGLDGVILVPSYNPPHKNKDMAPFADRVKMLELYKGGREDIIIDTVEGELALEDSYAYIIIGKLQEKYPGCRFVYLIGGDSMVMFKSWEKPQIISKLTDIAVVDRKGIKGLEEAVNHARLSYGANIRVLDIDCREISSRELKARIELGFPTEDYIMPEIARYIEERGLYIKFSPLINKVKSQVSAELFNHIARTVIYAVGLSGALGLDYEKVFLAAFLHDIAKERPPLKASYDTVSYKVIHQYDGPEVAKTEFGITDPEILDAIEYHTTARPDMSRLGKLIYIADKLESERDFAGVETLRKAVKDDFEKGFTAVLNRCYDFVESKGTPVDVLTRKAFEYYNK